MNTRSRSVHVVFYAVLLIGICSLLGLFHELWWAFDLFNHFRPQAFLASSICLIISLLVKDKKSAALALSVIALNLALIVDRLYEFPAIKASHEVSFIEQKTRTVSVLFSNVLTSNNSYQPLLDNITSQTPDIIVITEMDDKWKTALSPIEQNYIYSNIAPRSDNFGMAIYSKFPFKSDVHKVGEYQLPLMVLDFNDFLLIAAHPLPPTGKEYAEKLHAYMKEISKVIYNSKKPLILVGDLNATLWSDTIMELRNLNLMRTNQLGLAWTWPATIPPLAIQIDHIFVRDAVIAEFEVLPDIGSDHFPIKSNITFYAR